MVNTLNVNFVLDAFLSKAMPKQLTKQCASKYHIGNREVSISSFSETRTGELSNRCMNCRAATEKVYNHSKRGKSKKHKYYLERKDMISERSQQRCKKLKQENAAKYIFQNAKIRAKRYGHEFTIDLSDVVVPSTCPVLHIPLVFTEAKSNNTPSLDRIDNTKGYVPGNVQVISWRANYMKRDMSPLDIELLYNYIKRSTK